MPDQRPAYLPMRGTKRLSRRQAELIIRALRSVEDKGLFHGQDLKNYRRAFAKLARAWLAAATAEGTRMEEESTMNRKPHGVMPPHWRKTLRDFAPLGSAREWSVAMGIHYSTFIRTFRVRDHSFGPAVRNPSGSDFKVYEERVLEMRRLLGIENNAVKAPICGADEPLSDEEVQALEQKKRVRSEYVDFARRHPDLALSIEQARKHWGSKMMRTIALETYKLDDEAMAAIHHLTWAR